MSQFKDNREIAVESAAAWDKGQRLYIDVGGKVSVCAANRKSDFTARRDCMAAGEWITVTAHMGGTSFVVANGAIAAGADLYGAANGKVASSGTVLEGVALEASTADGDIIEAMLIPVANDG